MNDTQLESSLRATLAARAETVTVGSTWDDGAAPRHRGRRARWLAPVAAAAVVIAVIAGVAAFRGTPHSSPAGLAGQVPIPKGMKAVDALGVEIFVPKLLAVDAGSCYQVSRPVPSNGVKLDCSDLLRRLPNSIAVSIDRTLPSATKPTRCVTQIRLAGESGCVTQSSYLYSVTWPQLGAGVSVIGMTRASAIAILTSAHAVPVDRNGCAATASSLAPSPTASSSIPNIPDPADIHFDSELLPVTPTRSLSVCWYIDNRLVASAKLGQAAARSVIQVANGGAPMWPSPPSRPTLPSCDSLAATDGVLLTTHAPGQTDVTAVADFAACNGQRTTRSATAAYLSSTELATALAKASGIPITLDYRANG